MVPALRRLAFAVLLSVGVTAAGSALVALLIGGSLDRSLVLGFYLVGCFLMVAGFFSGNRGPTRVKSESPAASAMPFGVFSGARRLRWATLGEQDEAINTSAVFVGLGILLVLIGVLLDGRHSIF
jgi:4-amino-4-deoxy-L-arabinose transferase-like glycosyltransferase